MHTTITTIGTSLLTNKDSRPWAPWTFGQPLPAAAMVDTWLKTADLKQASAETHTWLKLDLLDEPRRHRLLLVHTNTDDGRFCAERLKAWAQGRGLDCEIDEIAGLGTEREDTFNLGLAELARQLALHVENRRREGVAIAATGGFKAEIAIAGLVGALLGAPVHYLYNNFERPVTLEPLPIELNPAALRTGAGAALLDRLAGARGTDGDRPLLRRPEIDSLLRQDPRLDLYLETTEIDGEEYAGLNPIGEIARRLLDAPTVAWPPTSDVAPAEKYRLQPGHRRPNGWEKAVDKLARNAYVTSIRYDDRLSGKQGRIAPAVDNDAEVAVLIVDGSAPPLGLRVSTTARNAAERDLVLRHLARTVRL
jgi:putative CRISPR-associated protein (TIGR02619 family)